MRTNFWKTVLTAFFITTTAMAQDDMLLPEGGVGGGGGDDCENRIQNIASDLSVWIKKGGSKHLLLGEGVESKTYDQKMLKVLEVINSKELFLSAVECTSEKIYVNGTEKTCRWERLANKEEVNFNIRCNYERFMNGVSDENTKLAKEDAQYQLIHHEVAGVAGLEGSYKDRSNYAISNQIVASLESFLVRKLVVKEINPVIPVPMKGCKAYIDLPGSEGLYGIFSKNKKALRSNAVKLGFKRKGWDLVKKYDHADFIFITRFEDLMFGDHYVSYKIYHTKTGFVTKEDGALNQQPSWKIHPDNEEAIKKIRNAKTVNEKQRLSSQYKIDPSLNTYVEGIDVFQALVKSIPTCQELLGI